MEMEIKYEIIWDIHMGYGKGQLSAKSEGYPME
jgi:hypothetical protein